MSENDRRPLRPGIGLSARAWRWLAMLGVDTGRCVTDLVVTQELGEAAELRRLSEIDSNAA